MKNILKTSIFALMLVALGACENDTDPNITTNTATTLLTPATGTEFVLTEGNQDDMMATFVWEDSSYGVAAVPTYTLEIAEAGTNFENARVAGVSTETFLTFSVIQFNTLLVGGDTPLFEPFTTHDIDVRVKASLGNSLNAAISYSNVVTLTVTTYENAVVEDPELFFVGAPQGYYGLGVWDNATAIPMRYIGNGTTKVFECFVKVATGDGFKFIGEQGTWDNGNYGVIDNQQNGILGNAGSTNDIKVAENDGPGLYYVWVDIDNMTYKYSKMNWGIIGSATGGWDNEIPMAYDFGTNQFTIAPTLAAGELKFRCGNAGTAVHGDAWKFNVGNSDPTVVYNPGAGNFPIAGGAYNLGLIVNFDGTADVSGL